MADGPDNLRKGRSEKPVELVESLANEALKFLARQRVSGRFSVSETYVERLHAAVLDGSEDRRWALVEDMLADGIGLDAIIDIYVPTVARRLGVEWCEDDLGFAQVTVGSARLQGLMHELSRRTRPQSASDFGVAVMVIGEEYHTLGALVLTSQLRRLGVSVRLLIGARGGVVAQDVADGHFDAVFISASHSETLEDLAKFVKILKREMNAGTPIIIGGPILENCEDVAASTGAHFATSDVVEALRVCQLKTSRAARGDTQVSG